MPDYLPVRFRASTLARAIRLKSAHADNEMATSLAEVGGANLNLRPYQVHKGYFIVMLASLVLAAAFSAMAAPLAGLHYLVGTWSCTYRAGAAHLAYTAAYAYDLDGRTLRQIDSWAGGGGEELVAYNTQHAFWTSVVFDDQGTATIMRATGSDPNHIAYRSIYPDASIAEMFDRVSATEYTLHATVRLGGKTIASVDTCLRATR
jgi:hypothetical protein